MSFGYDFSCTTLSQEGKIYQLQYAEKAIENAPTVMGIVFSDGVLLASEKIRQNKTLVRGSNQTVYSVTPTIGLAVCGHLPDGRNLTSRAKSEAQNYLKTFGLEISGKILAERISLYVQAHTLYWTMRPFGALAMISSLDKDGKYHLYMVESNGDMFEYYSCSHGKGRQFVKTEVEKDNFSLKNKATSAGLFDVIKILLKSYEGEKDIEYDISVISKDTNGYHQLVDMNVIEENVRRAKETIEKEEKMQID